VLVVVGLGNPGERYARTRHNLGFRVVEALADRVGLRFGPVRGGCAAAAGAFGEVGIVLVKPLTYMNRSGEALADWARAEGRELRADGVPAADPPPLAVCDDIALPLGSLRLRAGGSDGGHRGLGSLARALGGTDFPRLRLGVDGSEDGIPPPDWADYVLADFPAAEQAAAEELVADACEALLTWFALGTAAAAGRHNRRGRRA
jgi:peptidyl-tRNA hydrolase, PTH1 family